jgi:hypothetical protein
MFESLSGDGTRAANRRPTGLGQAYTLATGLGPVGARVLEELGFVRAGEGRWLAKAYGRDKPDEVL